jgi:hypothetical protein
MQSKDLDDKFTTFKMYGQSSAGLRGNLPLAMGDDSPRT